MQSIRLSPHEIEKVVRFMQEASGNDFSDQPSLVAAKVGTLCSSAGYHHFWELWDAMSEPTMAGAQLRERVIDELTTNYSYFYRERAHFELLTRLLTTQDLPVGMGELRVWSAGCATGEEPYNIAMTIEDARNAGLTKASYHIVGSDISAHAIAAAVEGRYDLENAARMPPHWRSLYCERDDRTYRIKDALRRHVAFRHENVFAPRPDAAFDLVMCRNMLIYFDQPSIERFCALLRVRVKPGGYLFLGHTEILSAIEGFTYLEPSIWQRN